MHCEYNHTYTPTNAHNFYKTTDYPYAWTVLYASTVYSHKQGDINKKEYRIHPIYICNVIKIMETIMKMFIYSYI